MAFQLQSSNDSAIIVYSVLYNVFDQTGSRSGTGSGAVVSINQEG